jgi:hypothetical protein
MNRARLAVAAAAAGFEGREVIADVPEAIRPQVQFVAFDYDDPDMIKLREKYHLENVIASARDEWTGQLLLNEWLYQKIPGGQPRVDASRALDVLDYSARGEKFYCTHFALSYVECAQALGWQARKVGVDRWHGPEGLGSTHHGVAEVWSNQFRKWIVMDAQSNLHFERNGVPLSAWEIRAAWLDKKGAEVSHIVGMPPHSTTKNPAIVWWNRSDEDEIATYSWVYIQSRADKAMEAFDSKLIFPQDENNAGRIWYENDYATNRSQLHPGYIKNLFVPTHDLRDAYWTVCVVEASIRAASDRVIRLALDSYCPNRTGYEVAINGGIWARVKDGSDLAWPLKPGWNTIGLHTVGRRGVTGPETMAVMYLQ